MVFVFRPSLASVPRSNMACCFLMLLSLYCKVVGSVQNEDANRAGFSGKRSRLCLCFNCFAAFLDRSRVRYFVDIHDFANQLIKQVFSAEFLPLTFRADSITWADYWSAQKPGGSGSYSNLFTKMKCCQRLGDDDASWAGAVDCVCRPIVKYRTIHACGLSSACTAAARDIKNAQAKIAAFTNLPVTKACTAALNDAMCSYHFWGCSGNFPEEVYNNVCLDVCTALETSCR
jgi:hypothetical protein